MSQRGLFIVLDGGEGVGTTTASQAAVIALENQGLPVLWSREPGGSPYAEEIRKLILSDTAKHADAETMFGLFWAARRDHVVQTVIPALQKGATVICDRFDSSTWAYQIYAEEQRQLSMLFWAMRKQYLGEWVPDCYILLDVAPSIALPRAKSRTDKPTHFDERELDFHTKVREGFKEFTHFVPHRVIDAGESKEEVLAKVLHTIKETQFLKEALKVIQ